jgi:hypothetical protein
MHQPIGSPSQTVSTGTPVGSQSSCWRSSSSNVRSSSKRPSKFEPKTALTPSPARVAPAATAAATVPAQAAISSACDMLALRRVKVSQTCTSV